MEIRYKNRFENKENSIKPFNLRIQTLLNEIKINPKIMYNTILPKQHHGSSSSGISTSTDIPDPLLPLLPIVHHLWQVFRATSCILT